MASEITVGLHKIAGNANLTFIAFMAVTLLSVLGARFAFYARQNRSRTVIEGQVPIWRLLTYVGVFAMGYGLLGIVEIVTSIRTPFRSALMLGATLVLAFTIRRIHHTSHERPASTTETLGRLAFVVLVGAVLVAYLVLGPSTAVATVDGASALLFVAYGVAFYRDQTQQTRLQGTMIDSLLRHLLPVLTFASLVSIVNVARPFGLDRVVVLHVQVVFVIMTATALMTATIKLRQNLASL